MTLRVVPEGLAAASAQVAVLTARLAAANAAAAPMITAVLPPGSDPVSLQTAAGFSAQGLDHTTTTTLGVTELGRSGAAVAESGSGYAATDAAAAASYVIARGS
ncbi:PE family protein [Mycobacterium sp. EPa45]|uniref:PE family protein n=1 Tax=Mycobacterium sp. EPa45 TaxID=1545728 RepID=UPI0006418C31|nr:PE family protein [Mycobacterium sp. EPa45]AKK25736.1 cell motility protein [Mycobacterium sp. EPa45]